ncbi:NADH dehydrogenase (ubiquinone) complex I, assembly factor 6 [Nymphon striatum]|nr:NADH dehydrogenase (ubiquinone) complex I, assembly factor 6 [Nymphon striatum]
MTDMDWDQDLIACAGLVERGDPHRFRAAMAAPVEARAVLFPVYAFNVEVSRAPWVTQEPMIAEMRLQWWRDALEEIRDGKNVRRHEVVTPLSALLSAENADALDQLVAARRWDIYKDAFEDQAHFDAYIRETSGHLMLVSAQLLGPADAEVVLAYGYAAGVASFLGAVPELEARGRIPLLDGRPEGVQELAQGALDQLMKARSQRSKVSRKARAALLSGAQSAMILKRAISSPALVSQGALHMPKLQESASLGWQAMTGRY